MRTERGCLEWRGSGTPRGYGQLKIGGKVRLIHRLSWELVHGEVPEGMQVMHSCDNPPCWEIAHLSLGSPKDNMQDMFSKGRANKAQGAQHGNAKISEADAREILRLAATKELTQRAIAARYGLHPVYVNKMIKGHKWAHLQG